MDHCKEALTWKIADRFPKLSESDFFKSEIKDENDLGGQMIKQLLNSAIAKYRDLSVSRGSVIDSVNN